MEAAGTLGPILSPPPSIYRLMAENIHNTHSPSALPDMKNVHMICFSASISRQFVANIKLCFVLDSGALEHASLIMDSLNS